MIETTEINAALRKGAACRYCLKLLSKRRIREHENKCVAVNFPIPDGYKIERRHSMLIYFCPCGYKSPRSRIFNHMRKCVTMAEREAPDDGLAIK